MTQRVPPYMIDTAGATSGQVLTNQSGTPAWVNASGGGTGLTAISPTYVSNLWYLPYNTPSTATVTSGLNTLRLSIIQVTKSVTIKSIGVRVTTNVSLGNFQIGIYAHNPTTGRPTGTPIATTVSNLSTTSVGWISSALTSNLTLEPGLYWTYILPDSTAANGNAAYMATGSSTGNSAIFAGAASLTTIGSSATTLSFSVMANSQTFGAANDLTSVTFQETNSASGNGPVMAFQVV